MPSASVQLIHRNARGQTAVQEAGSIVWEDGSCHGFGRDQTRLDDPTLSFVRRIDFVSGACLLIDRGAFQTMGGFAADNYEAYYEDSDLQMRLKYKFGKYVYYQPLAVALHDEHGSFGGDTSVKLMRQGQQTFSKIWKQELTLNHLPYGNTPYLKLRAATRMHATKILYVDQLLPRHKIGSGFARAGDNVQLMARAFDGDAIVTAIGNEEVLANVEPNSGPRFDRTRSSCKRTAAVRMQVEAAYAPQLRQGAAVSRANRSNATCTIGRGTMLLSSSAVRTSWNGAPST